MSEPVYFLRLELENVRCFGEKATLDLSDGNGNWKKWTVILGDNGTGKTTLLQCLAGMDISEISKIKKIKTAGQTLIPKFIFNQVIFNNLNSEADAQIKATSSLTNEISIIQPPKPKTYSATVVHENQNLFVFGYGANRFMSNKSITDGKTDNNETLFDDDAKLINAEEWLLQLDYAASKDSAIKEFAIKKRDEVKQTLKDLLPDIEEIRFSTPTKENLKSTVEFKTPYGWVTIHQLSLGYKTMVAWMVDLAARMFERYPDSDNPLAEPAIVLVDEIDLHMHPKWQRKIFEYLSDKFPKTQFIVTAHSPLIVQSAPKEANIVLLKRDGDHVVIDNDIKSVQNWRLDQIMSSDLFGIDPRSPDTERWLDERKKLLQKDGELSAAEKQRLKELNEKAHDLPTADTQEDIEAMNIIREAAKYLKGQTV